MPVGRPPLATTTAPLPPDTATYDLADIDGRPGAELLLLGRDGRAWVTDWDGGLNVYAPSGRLLREVALGEEAHHLTFTPDGASLADGAPPAG